MATTATVVMLPDESAAAIRGSTNIHKNQCCVGLLTPLSRTRTSFFNFESYMKCNSARKIQMKFRKSFLGPEFPIEILFRIVSIK
jgi:hypothetical protein